MFLLLPAIWILTLLYLFLFLLYRKGWRQQPAFMVPSSFVPATKITVVIPARNEETNIVPCLQSIVQNKYPADLLEIIVVDDHSEDGTADRVVAFADTRVRCLRLTEYIAPSSTLNSYKKKAIETAVQQAGGDLILTTDADCTVSANWLRNFAYAYEQTKPAMIIAPVAFRPSDGLLAIFQKLDFIALQGITVAAHVQRLGRMCNGANLGFRRTAFLAVRGYEGIDHLASGDDYLLMSKMEKHFPGETVYLKSHESIVTTLPPETFSAFLKQRIRWASKNGKYKDHRLTAVLGLVYIFNLLLLALLIAGFFIPLLWVLLLALLLLKTAVELYFLLPVANFFKSTQSLWWFPLLQPLHVLYIVVAGFLGRCGKYEWKGRKVR